MMHVLAPCLNSLSEPTFFSDIYFLVGLNEDAALEVRELARRSIRQPELLHNLRFDSQLSGRTDVMVGLVSNKLITGIHRKPLLPIMWHAWGLGPSGLGSAIKAAISVTLRAVFAGSNLL